MKDKMFDYSYILAKAHVVVWTPCVSDGNLAAAVASQGNISERERVSVTRRLSNLPSLRRLLSIRTQVFTQFNALTWPCEFRGFRIASIAKKDKLDSIVESYRQQFEEGVREFVQEYTKIRTALDGIWPSPNAARDAFKYGRRFMPVPQDSSWSSWIREMRSYWLDEYRNRLVETLDEVAERVINAKRYSAATAKKIVEAVAQAADLGAVPESLQKILDEMESLSENVDQALKHDTEDRTAIASKVGELKQKIQSVSLNI